MPNFNEAGFSDPAKQHFLRHFLWTPIWLFEQFFQFCVFELFLSQLLLKLLHHFLRLFTTIVFVTLDAAGWDGRTTKPGFGWLDNVDGVTSVAVVGFFGWMEMYGFTLTILTAFCCCDESPPIVVTNLRFNPAEAAVWSWGSVVNLAGLPEGKNEWKLTPDSNIYLNTLMMRWGFKNVK